ncbi:hypothetical protein V5799_021182 [Amblyomma americanum]|uniref:Peptidase M13 C-terminal domain-containing protein n=1 Tax=Amblyomma americanum TaxID=6943 RepID=A0AAQ4FQZ1_AMBAM
MRDIFDITKLTKETLLRSIRTPRDIFNLTALLSYNYGSKPFVSFESSASRALTIRFSRPFSSYLNKSAVEAIFMNVAEVFYAEKKARLNVINALMSADKELGKALAGVKIYNSSPKAIARAAGEYVNPGEWRKIVGTYISPDERRSEETVEEAEGMKEVFNVLFRRLKPDEATVYAMSHALMPKPMVQLLLEDDRSEACLLLVRNLFGAVWEDLETYILGFFDDNHEAESVATTVLSTLNAMLSSHPRYANEAEARTALVKLDKVRFDIPSAKDFVPTLGKITPDMSYVSANSLYRNILLSQMSPGPGTNIAKNRTDSSRVKSGLSASSVALSAESFRPLSFCHGDYTELNFATLGTELAAALLRYVREPYDEVLPSSSPTKRSIFSALTSNVTACLESESKDLSSLKVIRQVALQTVAFQISLEAMKSRAIARTRPQTWEEAPDAPARQQTFFVRYCQAQCAKNQDRSGVATLDAAHACNLVVMNSPEFTRLFQCERGDQMVPAEYCLAL